MSPSFRRKARRFAMQALYQWQITEYPMSEIEVQFLADNDFKKTDSGYFSDAIRGVEMHQEEIDQSLMTAMENRNVEEADPIERAILRLAVYEFIFRKDVPFKVVINEAIELAKLFGATESHKYVNGALDKLAPVLRAHEVQQSQQGS